MTSPQTDALSVTKRALLEIRDLKARLAAYEQAAHEPIAIVGLGCRLPGGITDASSLWDVLSGGVDAVTDVPKDRWDAEALYDADADRPGRAWARRGGYLEGVADFDAAFFGISPREAASMDPQQRLFLEVAWEALEHAGIAPDSLAGTATGVFAGVGNSDYFRLLFGDREHIDAYAGSGGSLSIIPGRTSYVLGLQGPSLAIDTACSASLVAVHLACESLRRGESTLALAGGVNLILTPEAHIAFTKARMLAPDGRCKTFDAAADGYVRGEGCALVALRRLSDATARGDRVLAVIRGTAVNQDGRSGGLTAPNGPSQEAVIRAALAAARLTANDIDVVEAHGTGTSLGDPIELQALGAALGEGRDRPVVVGSCKTNFGHLEAAAGVAGLAKVVVSLMHRQVPPSLHFTTPNPLVEWKTLPVRVATSLEPWPVSDGPARAGVSSFGFGGTNAHIILEEAPATSPPANAADRTQHVLALSARDDDALRILAARYEAVTARDVTLGDVCATANRGRAQLTHRAAIVARDMAGAAGALRALAEGRQHVDLAITRVPPTRPAIAWLFTGQGAQRAGMGRTLYATSPAFRRAFDECASSLDSHLSRPIADLLFGAGETEINQTEFAQPALFALEYALASLWRGWGVAPDVVLGHSVGEIAAACVAGVLTLSDAARLIAARGRLMQELPAGGTMASIFAERSRVEQAVRGTNGAVEIAAFNGPEHVVVTGPRADVDTICDAFHVQGVKTKSLDVSHAFHSRLIEPMLGAFTREIAGTAMRDPHTTLISNLTGASFAPGTGVSYWRDHARNPVQFESSLRAAMNNGITHCIEIGPHPVLTGMGARFVEGAWPAWLPSLRAGDDDWNVILRTVQTLYTSGVDIDWNAFESDYARRRIDLPTYPFQRRRYWADWLGGRSVQTSSPDAWSEVSKALARQADLGPIGVDLAHYDEKWSSLARLTLGHAASVLRNAGIFLSDGERASATEVLSRIGAPDTYHHLIQRWLDGLVGTGALAREEDTYVARHALEAPDLDGLWREAEIHLADNQPLLAYLRRCGELIGDVVAGRTSPLETLFPGGSFELAEGLYERGATGLYINALAARGLSAFIASRTPGSRIRVLEIGAGTGGTSSSLIRELDPARTEYWYTDVTRVFLDFAETKFAAYPFVRFAELDLERDPGEQGFAPGTFDIVVSANAVHATRDLPKAIHRLHDLLAPGGMLMLVESTKHLEWFDMTTGLIEGWQHFDDSLRTDNPLLPAERWLSALVDSGFARADAWPRASSPASEMCQHVIVAQKVGDARSGADDVSVAATTSAGPATAAPARTAFPGGSGFAARISEAPAAERLDMLRTLVRDRAVHVLRLAPDQAPGRTDRLMDLGFDSLMAVQLRNALAAELQLSAPLSATLLFDYPTVDAIASHLLTRITPPQENTSRAHAPDPVATAPLAERVSEIATMSDADIEQLLRKRMDRK